MARLQAVSVGRVSSAPCRPDALPGFRDFYPQEFAERAYVFASRGATLRGGTRSPSTTGRRSRPTRALHQEERRRDRRPAVRVHGQGRPRRRAASRDDADVRADGGARARTRCASRCAGSPFRSCSATSASRTGGCASTSSSTSTSSARPPSGGRRRAPRAARIDVMRAFGLTHDGCRRPGVGPTGAESGPSDARGCRERRSPPRTPCIDKIERQPATCRRISSKRPALHAAADGRVDRGRRHSRVDAGRTAGTGDAAETVPARGAAAMDAVGPTSGPIWPIRRVGVGLVSSTSPSCAGSRTTPASSSSCSIDGVEFRAICGGGRYDNLLASLGGPDLAALGFGMGDVVLTELLRARGLLRPWHRRLDYWVAGEDSVGIAAVCAAGRLRAGPPSSTHAVPCSAAAQVCIQRRAQAMSPCADTGGELTRHGQDLVGATRDPRSRLPAQATSANG